MIVGPSLPHLAIDTSYSGGPSRGGFAVPESMEVPHELTPPTVARSAAASSCSIMLAIQEHAGEDSAEQQAKRHGHALLAELRTLQHALLTGRPGASARLAELASIDLRTVQPQLAHILSSIRLRARIELERQSRVVSARS